MEQLPGSITITIVLLTLFLTFLTALKYAVEDDFTRTRLIMTSFFFFIVATLTISFREYTAHTLPYTIPAVVVGIVIGYAVGTRTAEEKLKKEGASHYMRHFAHIHLEQLKGFTWWSIINFYSVMTALALINLVGLSTVIFRGKEYWAIATCSVGAFLLGTIIPYLAHLWSIRAAQNKSRTRSER